MPTALRLALPVAALVLLLSAPARAWTPTDMFSSGGSKQTKTLKKTSRSKAPAKPGVVDTLTSGPKKLYSSTKALVTPSKKAAAPATRPRTDTWKNTSTPGSPKSSTSKSWFAPAEPPPLPRTVGEWMKQKRVEP